MTTALRAGITAAAGVGVASLLPEKAKSYAGAAAGVGVGYAAASLLSNPNGQVATTVTKGATEAGKFLNDAIKNIKGSDAYKSVAKYTSDALTKAKGTEAYKTAANYVKKGASKIAQNGTFQKVLSTVKNSSVGKWVMANPKLAAGVAAATVLIGFVTKKSKES